MNISIKSFRDTFSVGVVGTAGILGLSLLMISEIAMGGILSLEYYSYIILFVSSLGIGWYAILGKKLYSNSTKLLAEYTRDTYLMILSMTGRDKDEEDVSMDFYNNVASEVFPEIKEADIESIKKTDEAMEVEEVTVEVKKKGDYTFDAVALLGANNFIIKQFNKKVNSDDLEECINVANKEYDKNIFRLVFLAEEFDAKILNDYKKLKDTMRSGTADLILFNDKGFSTLQIGS